jgi:hypothetical protein
METRVAEVGNNNEVENKTNLDDRATNRIPLASNEGKHVDDGVPETRVP